MAAKQQKFKVKINPKYSEREKQAIAQDIIDHIYKRTVVERKDAYGKSFKGYSEKYADTLEARTAGKTKGQTANLKLTGDMMDALGDYQKIGKTYIEIGFTANSEDNGKADGNIMGTYGKKTPSASKSRDFLGTGLKSSKFNGTSKSRGYGGVTNDELNTILADYPLKDKEKLDKTVSIVKAAAAIAAKNKPQEN